MDTPFIPTSRDYRRAELVWPGKRTQVERVALPFQVVETINQSRATREQTPMFAQDPLRGVDPFLSGSPVDGGTPRRGWTNKLIWGENKYVMASLLEEFAGKVNLIYIDPPFATGQDFSYRARVGDEEWVKEASIIEETAYRDTWGRGLDSYLQMMYDRLVLMRDLLAEDGSIYVHMDWHVGHYVKAVLDEVFGTYGFQNEVIWQKVRSIKWQSKYFGNVHDTILLYSRTEEGTFNPQFKPKEAKILATHYRYIEDQTGRRYRLSDFTQNGDGPSRRFGTKEVSPPPGKHWIWSQERIDKAMADGRIVFSKTGMPSLKRYLDEVAEDRVPDIWDDLFPVNPMAEERQEYATQKPEALLERIILASSNEGDLVADFFSGSGTTMAVAEKLGRRWIGCDLSRYAIRVSRKRLLDIPDCKPFEVLNLGRYERQHWQVNVLNGRQEDGSKAITDYLRFIVELYHAEPVGGYANLHGQKAGRWVHVGAADAPVTRAEIMDAVRECQAHRYTGLDVLGWEWEMGLHDTVRDEVRRMGVDLRLLTIPREVMDRRAVQAGDVHFYELAYLKTSLLQDGRMLTVKLEDFIIPNLDLVPEEVRRKIKRWSDYIDFWAVDWNYHGDTFHNEWQTYRTRKSPTLRLISDPHTYAEPNDPSVNSPRKRGEEQGEGFGEYRILVKVIDIFGNDTAQLLEANVP